MTTIIKRISLLLALAAGLALSACGGDEEGDPIPAENAQALQAELERIQARLDEGSAGACRDILEAPEERGANLTAVERQLEQLPEGVDPGIRDALERSFENLWELVRQECDEKQQQEEAAQPEPEPEPDPTLTETETETVPETTPTVPPDTELPPDQQELPPEGDGDNEGDVPGGDGGGGFGPGGDEE